MNATDFLTAICALVLMVVVAGGLHTLQVWLER
jgi:hypothetical protein